MERGEGGEAFSANVAKDEEGKEPGEFVLERFSRSACLCARILRVFGLIDCTGLIPEGAGRGG
jgi:hypothetical protein